MVSSIGMASDVGKFFSTQFNNVKDLFAKDQSELQNNINRVKDLLKAIQEKAGALKPLASDAQKKTLDSVDGYLKQVTEFGDTVAKDGKEKFAENEQKWQGMVDQIFTKGGLDSVMKLLNLKSATSCTIVAALVAPLMLAFTR
ncbi:unnamed protein product [Nippostrongylus brasiliensis]|uniref:TMhelix containing protein n=1 Tax=Nippostrongylus brasiliensis TaxID=27835 RepID=A0A0N4XD85_NIPBR|nr:unnamed protein product [Nippostrongylus brasiliensis]